MAPQKIWHLIPTISETIGMLHFCFARTRNIFSAQLESRGHNFPINKPLLLDDHSGRLFLLRFATVLLRVHPPVQLLILLQLNVPENVLKLATFFSVFIFLPTEEMMVPCKNPLKPQLFGKLSLQTSSLLEPHLL